MYKYFEELFCFPKYCCSAADLLCEKLEPSRPIEASFSEIRQVTSYSWRLFTSKLAVAWRWCDPSLFFIHWDFNYRLESKAPPNGGCVVFIKFWGLNLFGHGSHLNFKLLLSKWFLISNKPILILFTHHLIQTERDADISDHSKNSSEPHCTSEYLWNLDFCYQTPVKLGCQKFEGLRRH